MQPSNSSRRQKFVDFVDSANNLKRAHGALAVLWVLMVPVALLTNLKNSVPFLVFVSLYALIVGHWSSWQSSRTEILQEKAITNDPPQSA
jgi:hypothetical protein